MSATAYDARRYPYAVRPFTHPARLGVVARLFGAEAAPFENCRVLEIGGGDGVNILSMALGAPDSEFLNVDLSHNAIAQARDLAARAGVRNLRQEAADVLDMGEEPGGFDYIIAHGVYAWTPAPVRAGLMAFISRALSSRGIAMISYNALPGCHIRRAVRDLAFRAAGGETGPDERVAAARDALAFHLAQWDRTNPAQAAFADEAERLLGRPDGVIFHDELCEAWEPQYLSEVVGAARAVGLDYLGDTQVGLIGDALFPGALQAEWTRRTGGDDAAFEQLQDFTQARSFRQTLLRRRSGPLDRRFAAERLRDLWAEGSFERLEAAHGSTTFRSTNGGEISTRDPRVVAMLERLSAAWPRAVRLGDVVDGPDLLEGAARLFVIGALGLATSAFRLVGEPGERPRAGALARIQAEDGSDVVTTLRHTQARLDDAASRSFLSLLDGSRTRGDLTEAMTRIAGESPELAGRNVDATLRSLAAMALIEA